ncbi:MAG: PPC domain-containing protein [Elainellaceae cyanobacterium]
MARYLSPFQGFVNDYDYPLNLKISMSRKAFDSFDDARKVGNVNGRKALKGAISRSDKVDFFELNLLNRSSFTIKPQRVKSNLKVRLFSNDESTVGKIKFKRGQKRKSLERELAAGTYFVQVQGRVRKGNSRYKLRASAQAIEVIDPPLPPPPPGGDSNGGGSTILPPPPPPPSEPGETPDTAFNIGQLPGAWQNSEFVGTGDDSDFYRFEVNTVSDFGATIIGLTDSTDTFLYKDSNKNGILDDGGSIASSTNTDSGSISRILTPGTYYLQINRDFGASTQYELNLTRVSYPSYTSNPDPGEATPSALSIGNLPATYTARDYVGQLDETDFYRFTVNTVSDLSVVITGATESLDTFLYRDSNNNGILDDGGSIASSTNTDSGSISRILTPGTYYLQINRDFGDSTRYDLNISRTSYPSYTSNPEPGSATPSALSIGNLPAAYTAKDYVGQLDEADFYKFTINTVSDFAATVVGAPSSLDTFLYKDSNNNGILDDGGGIASSTNTGSASISGILTPGTYYLQVNRDFGDSTRYDLNIARTSYPDYTSSPEPGGDTTSALSIGNLSGSYTAQDYIGQLDAADFYRFTVNTAGNFSATVVGVTGSFDTFLYLDSNNNGILDDGNSIESSFNTTTGSISSVLAPGTYYLQIRPDFGKSTRYDLTLNYS